ncbi:MAG TPA: TIGR03435 family protein [Bryobacteraceae bacterium]|nr:TIGR03435 family protein [Bryobacteraceae bacterium]
MVMLRFLTVASLTLCSGAVFAQTPATPHPQFEVASIKPAAPDARGMFIRMAPGGRLNVTNMPLKEMIVIAWRIQPYQVSGGPGWINSARYDINAKPETNPAPDQIALMLRSLLEDRFQLKFHRDTKEESVYALVLANEEGKLGPKLTPAKEGGCTPRDPSKPPALPEPGQPPTLPCGGMMMSPSSMMASDMPISNMIPMLSRTLGRTVIDKTGLTGKYDISLQWTPDEAQAAQFPGGGAPPGGPPGFPPPDPNGPSLFTALEEQLGLKLESQKGPVEMFVIDSVQRPSEN